MFITANLLSSEDKSNLGEIKGDLTELGGSLKTEGDARFPTASAQIAIHYVSDFTQERKWVEGMKLHVEDGRFYNVENIVKNSIPYSDYKYILYLSGGQYQDA